MNEKDQYSVKPIEHLGLVAEMVDELEIVPLIDSSISQDMTQRKVSIGECVKAMIINGLGFTNHRLSMTETFYENKPVARLIRKGVQASHLNDDTLGRALDTLYKYGVTAIFDRISRRAVQRLGLQPSSAHVDSTTFHVDGVYNSEQEEVEPGVIHLKKGYSRDHRPDLNQFTLNLIVENQAGIPQSLTLGHGNESDKQGLAHIIAGFVGQLQVDDKRPLIVVDAGWYTADNVAESEANGYHFVSRVPATLKAVKQLLTDVDQTQFKPLKPWKLTRGKTRLNEAIAS